MTHQPPTWDEYSKARRELARRLESGDPVEAFRWYRDNGPRGYPVTEYRMDSPEEPEPGFPRRSVVWNGGRIGYIDEWYD